MKTVWYIRFALALLLLISVSGCGGGSSGAEEASNPSDQEKHESGSNWGQMLWDKGKWG